MEFISFISPLRVYGKVHAVLLREVFMTLQGVKERERQWTSNVSRCVFGEEKRCNRAAHVL